MIASQVRNFVSNLLPQGPPRRAPLEELAGPAKDWTVLVYMDGRDGLAHSTDLALNKLEQMGSTASMHVIAQAALRPTLRERFLPNMRSLPTRRYYIQRDSDEQRVTSPIVGEGSTSLEDFVAWGMEKFPARHTMLVVKRHGTPGARDVAEALSNVEQRTGQKLDVVAFDSCATQNVEVAYELRNHAAVVTGSQDNVRAMVFPYGNLALEMHRNSTAGAREMGEKLVETYAAKAREGLQSALDLRGMERFAGAVKEFVDEAIGAGVSRDLLYTSMQQLRPMERRESLNYAYTLRDLGSFLHEVAEDERYPTGVREAAQKSAEAHDQVILARFSGPGRRILKGATGMNGFFPWKALSTDARADYARQEWSRDSGWSRLLDYVLDGPGSPTSKAPQVHGLGQWALSQYKKYISPSLETQCGYSTSCSEFARQSVEKFGLWEGGKIGLLRFFGCDGQLAEPAGHVCSEGCKCKVVANKLISPPSPTHGRSYNRLIRTTGRVGAVVGGLALGLLAIPVGAALGWTSGTKDLEAMSQRYDASVVHGYEKATRPLVQVSAAVRARVARLGSPILADCLGAMAGAAAGMAGAAVMGFKWGHLFAGLWAENRLKDALGELPRNPRTEAILESSYGRKDSETRAA